jgi:peptidoglycan/xylan/chitin deacetylase (PgdA/CDA1 family)
MKKKTSWMRLVLTVLLLLVIMPFCSCLHITEATATTTATVTGTPVTPTKTITSTVTKTVTQESEQSKPWADSVPPTVAITGLTDRQIIAGAITLAANVSDNVGVVGVQFVIDGHDFGRENTAPPYRIELDAASLSNGTHYISARARDAAGNKSTSNAVSVVIARNVNPNPAPVPGGFAINLIRNPSLETRDSSGNMPLYWSKGNWGTNQTVFTYPAVGNNSSKAAKVEMTQYTDGDAKWYFDDVAVTPGLTYKFSDYYISNTQTTVTCRFTLSDGTYAYDDLGYPSASWSWQNFTKTFQAPSDAISITVFHLLKSVGYLTVDNFSLTEVPVAGALSQGMVSLEFDDGWLTTYQNAIPILNTAGLKSTQYIISGTLGDTADGYVSASNVLAMQRGGHEIGSHSRTHVDLTTLSSTSLQSEVWGSRKDLLRIGVTGVTSFAYPYGAENSTVVSAVKSAGYTGARGIDFGLNGKNTDRYNLLAKSVELNTSLDAVKAWIDDATANKQWLILYFHNIDYSGTQYSTTPENLQQIVNYLVSSNVKVVTNSEGVRILSR